MSQKIIIANWKMNKSVVDSVALANEFNSVFPENEQLDSKVYIAASVTALSPLSDTLHSNIGLTAQDCSIFADYGAYTGETSAKMLKDMGVVSVIIGHSERRQKLQESNIHINQKLINATNAGLTAILCIGETITEREAGQTETVITQQLSAALLDVPITSNIIVAYEPVWAISTTANAKVATTADAANAISMVRQWLQANFPSIQTVIYGGSANSTNAKEFLATPGIDGLLVGGASLDAAEFRAIVA